MFTAVAPKQRRQRFAGVEGAGSGEVCQESQRLFARQGDAAAFRDEAWRAEKVELALIHDMLLRDVRL